MTYRDFTELTDTGAPIRVNVQRVEHSPDDRRVSAKRERLVPISWEHLSRLPKREPLIEGVLDVGAMSAVIGATGAYKTGTAIDWGGHIALGRPWRGHDVRKGVPLYLAVEGGRGIAERLEAWRYHHGVEADQAKFYVIPEPIDLAHGDADTKLLLSRISGLGGVDFVVVDTVSRALAGGDENSPKDMGAFVRNCDLIRDASGAHLCSLHHLGKDENRGARGHSLLKAALDTEITATKNGRIGSIELTKQRDGVEGQRWGFAIEIVDLGDGKSSYVVVPADAPQASKASAEPRLTKNQQTMFSILHTAGSAGLTTDQWYERARDAGLGTTRKADLYDFREALKSKGLVRQYGDRWTATS